MRGLRKIFGFAVKLILVVALMGALWGSVLWFLGLSLEEVRSIRLPQRDTALLQFPQSFAHSQDTYFERQGHNQCAGYSAAYLLRLFGEEIEGDSAYAQMRYDFKNGYILPSAVKQLFEDKGYTCKMLTGGLESLKNRVANGMPVIVLVGDGLRWQHYVTVVGYDEKSLYLFDSNTEIEGAIGHNRTLSNEEFLQIWQNGIPGFEQLYFVVNHKSGNFV